MEGSRLQDPLVQPWTYIEQPRTPQQDNFNNTTETRLACGIYTVLSSLYAVRNWEIDFVQQTHIRQARNGMAAIGHAIHEIVSLHRCSCGLSYEQWGSQPTPPFPTCKKTFLKNMGLGTRKRVNDNTTDRTPEVTLIVPSPGPTPSHGSGQDYNPKRIKKRSGPSKNPRESKVNITRRPPPLAGGRGLRNCGSTCFLNATIQCLGAIDEVNHAQLLTNQTTTTQDKLMICIRELQQPGTAYVPTPLIQRIPQLICYQMDITQ